MTKDEGAGIGHSAGMGTMTLGRFHAVNFPFESGHPMPERLLKG